MVERFRKGAFTQQVLTEEQAGRFRRGLPREQIIRQRQEFERRRTEQQEDIQRQEKEKREAEAYNQKIEKIKFLIAKASKIDRGKPFALWGESKQDVELVNAYIEGIGKGTKQERRTRFLRQMFPNVEPGVISQAVSTGTVTEFGTQQVAFGLDPGETRKFTTRSPTGEIIRTEIITKTKEGKVTRTIERPKTKAELIKEIEAQQQQSIIGLRELSKEKIVSIAKGEISIQEAIGEKLPKKEITLPEIKGREEPKGKIRKIIEKIQEFRFRKIPEVSYVEQKYIGELGDVQTKIVPISKKEAITGYKKGFSLDLGVLTMGAFSTPQAITPILLTGSRVGFIGSIRQGGKASEVRVFGRTIREGEKPTYDLARQILTRRIGVTTGIKYEVERALKIPKGTIKTEIKAIQPYIDISKISKVGEVKIISEVGGVKAITPTDTKAYISGRKVILLVKETKIAGQPVYAVLGGQPSLRIYRKGGISYILREVTAKGILLPSTFERAGIKILRPATIKKTPISKTFEKLPSLKAEQLAPVVSIIKKATLKPEKAVVSGRLGILPATFVGASLKPSRLAPVTKPVETLALKPKEIQREKLAQIPTQKLQIISVQREKLVQIPSARLKTLAIQREKLVQIPKPVQILRITQRIKPPIIPPLIKPPTPIRPPKPPVFFTLETGKPKKPTGISDYMVAVRRRGVFRPVGAGLTLKEAITIGRLRTARTLAATFKITRARGRIERKIPTPFGFYQKKRKGLVFIEQPRFRLSTRPEVREIQIARVGGRR